MSKNAMVSYHNRFNSVFLEPLSATQQNCLYALFHKLKDKGGDTIVISKKELVLLTGFEKGGNRDFKEYIFNTISALQNLKLRNTIDDKVITQFVIFPKLEYNTETETMSVKVAKDFQCPKRLERTFMRSLKIFMPRMQRLSKRFSLIFCIPTMSS